MGPSSNIGLAGHGRTSIGSVGTSPHLHSQLSHSLSQWTSPHLATSAFGSPMQKQGPIESGEVIKGGEIDDECVGSGGNPPAGHGPSDARSVGDSSGQH